MDETGSSRVDTLLCPHCLVEIEEHTHFCPKCLAPLTSHAATDPIGWIWSMGYLLRTGIKSPRSPIVLIGFWLLFGSSFLINTCRLLSLVAGFTTEPIFGESLLTMAAGVLLLLTANGLLFAILFQVTRNYLRQHQT